MKIEIYCSKEYHWEAMKSIAVNVIFETVCGDKINEKKLEKDI